MKATDVLKAEHRTIKRMLAVMDHVAGRVDSGEDVPVDHLRDAVRFVREYADRTHHGKEEVKLFPVLMEKGMPEEGPIGQMLKEHVSGRDFVSQLSDALDRYEAGSDTKAQIVAAIRGYTSLLRRHIQKEDMILFSMADKLLSNEEDEALYETFCRVDRELISKAEVDKWNKVLDDYEQEYNLPKEPDTNATAGCLAFAESPDDAVEELVKEFKKK